MKTTFLAALAALGLFSLSPARADQPTESCAVGVSASGQHTEGCLIQPQSTASAVESSHVFKASGPATLVSLNVSNASASAIWVMVFDANVAPTAGAVTGCPLASSSRPCVAQWYEVAANSTLSISPIGPFPQLQSGIVLACSSTGPFTLTYTVNCAFSAMAM